MIYKMNIVHLILLSQLVLVRGGLLNEPLDGSSFGQPPSPNHKCSSYGSTPHMSLLQHVKIGIINNSDVISHVNLQQTTRVLANEHLPIWISNEMIDSNSLHDETRSGLERNHEVMDQLGQFTTYQDPESSSAAIYFHKRHEFDGMIDYEFFIQNLSIDEIDPDEETLLLLDRVGVYHRPEYRGHQDDPKTEEGDPEAGVNCQEYRKTYGCHVYDGYPEVLVIVSWDVSDKWTREVNEVDRYKTIVSHVLTLFNGIDMLYSKLRNIKVQINIAGIIIEEEDSFLFMESCYYYERTGISSEHKLDGDCVNAHIREYMYARRRDIPVDSYDMVIFLTREDIYAKNNKDGANRMPDSSEGVFGISSMIKELYISRKKDFVPILVGTITSSDYIENYPTIAHEMAHLMTVYHDAPQFFTHDGECCGKLMKTGGGWCGKCLSWSETSEESLKLFFGSPNCCTFINEPRSLNPPGRHKMLTADEQCQCYGYESAMKFRELLVGFCRVKLRCEGARGKLHHTVIPMDGTPCRKNEVKFNKCTMEEGFIGYEEMQLIEIINKYKLTFDKNFKTLQ